VDKGPETVPYEALDVRGRLRRRVPISAGEIATRIS
jgi:hypothetical protein